MPEMSVPERLFCRSRPWRWFAGEVILPWALRRREPYGCVLELGAGSGAMAARLLRRYPDLRITATDYDPAMVELAREILRPFGERADVRQADASSLPFEDESFDCVLSFIMLHHVGRWENALAEAARVLRPGGVLAGYDLLESAMTRGLHKIGRGHGERLIGRDELGTTLARLPLTGIEVARTGPLLVRFSAAKR